MFFLYLLFYAFSYEKADVKFEVAPLPGNGLSIKASEHDVLIFNQNISTLLTQPIYTETCFLEQADQGYTFEYNGQDGSNLSFFIKNNGNILVQEAQNTRYKEGKSWGFKTDGSVINQGESLFAGFYTQSRETHNLGILKTKYFEIWQQYIFNRGIIHSGDFSDTVVPAAYARYLLQVDQNAVPQYEHGIFDDHGVTLIEGTLKLINLKHRVRNLVQVKQALNLENSNIENHGEYVVDESITGYATNVENFGRLSVGFMSSTTFQAGSWLNKGFVNFSRSSDLWTRNSLQNDSGMFCGGDFHVGCHQVPQNFGILQSNGQLQTKIGLQAAVADMEKAYNKAAFFSSKKVIIDVLKHTDHMLNTITDHYTADQYGNRKYSHRTETGYVFQHRTTERTRKEVDANSADLPPEIAQLLQKQKEQLEAFKKQLDALKEHFKQAEQASAVFDGALEKYLMDLGLNPDEIKSILDDHTPRDVFRKLYQQQSMHKEIQNLLHTTIGLLPRFDFNPIQWAQANAGNIFEALLQGGDWLANLARRSSNPYLAAGSQGYSVLRGVQKTQQTLNRAQILLSRRQGGDKSHPSMQTGGTSQPPTQPVSVQNPPKAGTQYKIPKPGLSDKEGAKNPPSWAKGHRPKIEEDGNKFATRLMDEKYGQGNYGKGPSSEYNQIQKWGDRAFVKPN